MAGRIAGITIEIGGDTTKLQQALSKTDGTLKKTQTALKDVNKLLKLDPGNTVLLQQKQKDLSVSIQTTKQRLEQLNEAQRQMAGRDLTEAEQQQYEALQREIVETEQKLKSLDAEMKEFGSVGAQKIAAVGQKWEEVGGKISAFGDKLSSAGQALLPVTGVIVAAGTAAVKSWQEVDSAGDTIIKKTGATGEALAEMQEMMADIAETIPTSFETAGSAIGEVNTRFDLTGDALRALSEDFIKFADLNDTDVSSSVDAVQKAMAAWGVETKDASLYLDALNTASQKTGVSAITIAGTAATNAAALKELGFSASDAALFLGNLEKNGVDTSAVMTGLKKAYANAVKEGGNLNDSLADLEARLQNESTHTQAAAEAIELFGSRAGGALAEAISTGRLSFADLGTELQDFAGNVGSTFESTLDPLDEVKTSLNQLKSTGAGLVNAAGPLIKSVIEKANSSIQNLTKYLDKLNDKQKQTIVKVAAVVAAVGPALTIGGKLISGVGNVVSAGGKLLQLAPKIVSAISAAKAGFLALNPVVGAGVIAVATLTAGIIAIKKSHDDYIESTWGLTEAQKEANQAIADNAAALAESEQARKEAMQDITNEYGYYERLAQELLTLTDADGKVLEGKEARAEFIVGTLNDALGLEIEMVDGVVTANDDLAASIESVITKKKAEAYLAADQEAYTKAIQEQKQAQMDYISATNKRVDAEGKLAEAQEAYSAALAEQASATVPLAYAGQVASAKDAVEKATASLVQCENAEKNAEKSWLTMVNTISNHEALAEAATSGENLDLAMQNLANGFVTAENATHSMLLMQLSDFTSKYDQMKAAAEQGSAAVTEAELAEMAALVERARAEYYKGGVDSVNAMAEGMNSASGNASAAAGSLESAAAPKGTNTAAWSAQGTADAGAYNTALNAQAGKAKTSSAQMAQGGVEGAKSKQGEMNTAGTEGGQEYASGMEGTGGTSQAAGTYVADSARSGAASVDLYPTGYTTGSNYALGLIAGMLSQYQSVVDTVTQLTGAMGTTGEETLDENSPSKVAIRTAIYYGEGLIVGMKRKMPEVARMAQALSGAVAVQPPAAMINYPAYQEAAASAVQRIMIDGNAQQNAGVMRMLSNIYDRLERMDFYMDGDTWIASIFDRLNSKLGFEASLQERYV